MPPPQSPDRVVTKSNLKGAEAIRDWKAYGVPILCDLLSESQLEGHGRAQVVVRDCHGRKPSPCRQPVRIRREEKGARFVGLVITPFASRYWYEVDVTIARGLAFPNSMALVRLACQKMERPNYDDEPEPEPEPPMPVADMPTPTPSQTDRLVKMRDGITVLLERGRQIADLQAEWHKANGEATKINAENADLIGRIGVARDTFWKATEHNNAMCDQVRQLEEKLGITKAEAKKAAITLAEANGVYAKLEDDWKPLAVRLSALQHEMENAETLIDEQNALSSKAGDMSLLLAALEKLT